MTDTSPRGRVLVIAGSDSGGGAGIQADIKSIMANGGYAMTAVTAVTVQNTQGVFDVIPIPPTGIADQIRVTTSDIGVDAIKTGMLGSRNVIETVAEAVDEMVRNVPSVVDPVMVATSGDPLLAVDAIDVVRSTMVPLATLLTPNAPEAALLSGREVYSLDGQRRAADAMLELGAKAVLVKGGHLEGDTVIDVLQTQYGEHFFESERIESQDTHGTGCTLASAITAQMAQGVELVEAVELGRTYLLEAIRRAPGFGKGHGPVHHGWPLDPETD